MLQTHLQSCDVATVDLDKTVVIYSTGNEINAQCLERLQGNAVTTLITMVITTSVNRL